MVWWYKHYTLHMVGCAIVFSWLDPDIVGSMVGSLVEDSPARSWWWIEYDCRKIQSRCMWRKKSIVPVLR